MDEILKIEISIDKMLACMTFGEADDKGKKLTPEQIREAIKAKGIIYGIDEEVMQEIYSERTNNYKYFFAKGEKPITGDNAYMRYAFDVEVLNKSHPTLKTDGSVDFKDLNIIHNVVQGEVLAVKVQAGEGTSGYNVLGEAVKGRKGKDVRMPMGKNTTVLDDGITLVALADGQVEYDQHNLYISHTFFVNEDVDSSTGNIDFIGNVVIKGIVHSGFSVKAGGNVEVYGYVEAAVIEAGGDIILHHGVQGSGKGRLRAQGNIIAKFIQNSELHAGGDIITEAILHSEVSSNGEIFVQKGKGTIVGGTIITGRRIVANIIGSTMATITTIQIGVSKELINDYQELKDRYIKLNEEIDKLNKSILFLETRARGIDLPPDKKELLEKLINTRFIFINQTNDIKVKYAQKEELIRNSNRGIIKVKNKIYPGVKVVMGNQTRYIVQEENHCIIQKQDGAITVGSW